MRSRQPRRRHGASGGAERRLHGGPEVRDVGAAFDDVDGERPGPRARGRAVPALPDRRVLDGQRVPARSSRRRWRPGDRPAGPRRRIRGVVSRPRTDPRALLARAGNARLHRQAELCRRPPLRRAGGSRAARARWRTDRAGDGKRERDLAGRCERAGALLFRPRRVAAGRAQRHRSGDAADPGRRDSLRHHSRASARVRRHGGARCAALERIARARAVRRADRARGAADRMGGRVDRSRRPHARQADEVRGARWPLRSGSGSTCWRDR